MRLLYLLGTFPRISSEVCILNEIIEMKRRGHHITIIAGDRESDAHSRDVTENGLLEDTIHFRDYRLIRKCISKGSGSVFSVRLGQWSIGLIKTMNFMIRISLDLIRHPVKTSRSIKNLCRTQSNIYHMSDTYLGFRKLRTPPDLIHAQFPHLNHLDQAEFLSMEYGCPFTLTFRAHDLHEKINPGMMEEKIKAVKKAKAILTISQYNKDTIREVFGRESTVIHSAINLERFKPGKRNSEDQDLNRLLYVGRYVEKKGLKYLIKACKVLKEKGTPFHLDLIGDGPLRSDLEIISQQYGVQDMVSINDPVPQEELIDTMRASDIFVMPSIVTESGDTDILPNALKEAMAMEIAVITTDISGIRELVQDGISGILVEPKRADSIAEAIERLIADPKFRRRLGEEGRKKIECDFNIKIEAEKIDEFFMNNLDPQE